MNDLMHYGMPRRSGRYPYGSGKDPFQHNGPDKLAEADKIKREHPEYTNTQIANALGISRNDYEAMYSARKDLQKAELRAKAFELRDNPNKQYSYRQIAKELGVSEGTVRNIFSGRESRRLKELETNMDVIRGAVKENKYIDVSEGVAETIGITESQLKAAYTRLATNGEVTINTVKIPNGSGHNMEILVLSPIDSTYAEIQAAVKRDVNEPGGIKTIQAYGENGGRTLKNLEPIQSIDPSRVKIVYREDGGADKDGVIEIRRGVEDLSLGNAHYAQVRIAVNDTHYLKGMAVYGDKFPPGVDILFNTNKHKGTPMLGNDDDAKGSVLKSMKDDPNNPFGASIKPSPNLVKCQGKGAKINVVNEEGDWDKWSKKLASQFLSKQPNDLIKRQLDYTYDQKKAEFEEIKSLTNPTVKKHLMMKFASSCDSDAVDLKAAAFPRQGSKVILPLPKIDKNQVYAPGYKNGERVVLLRYPHQGTFELPELKVNNNIPDGKRLIGNSKDAIGIHPKTAQQLSGADFDGDTVMVLPKSARVNIKTRQPLKGLKDFDPKDEYPPVVNEKGKIVSKIMGKKYTQKQMGEITNLVTDMTLKGAPDGELTRAVKHAQVVIDANKHKLNYKLSEEINGISALKKKYQPEGGASTVVSRAKSPKWIYQRNEKGFDKETGERLYYNTNAKAKKKLADGTWIVSGYKKMQVPKMDYYNDARKLLSKKPNYKELAYADYANKMKALGNAARKATLAITPMKYNPTAAKAYSREVKELERKLNNVQKQKPLERQARIIANAQLKASIDDDPTLYDDKERKNKYYQQYLDNARYRVGHDRTYVEITPREWAAIQSGAIHATKAKKILEKAKPEDVRSMAMPKNRKGISTAKALRIEAMLKSGTMTQTEIAQALGVSVSTVRKYI